MSDTKDREPAESERLDTLDPDRWEALVKEAFEEEDVSKYRHVWDELMRREVPARMEEARRRRWEARDERIGREMDERMDERISKEMDERRAERIRKRMEQRLDEYIQVGIHRDFARDYARYMAGASC